jgi:D-3-phosphoglycerate dehydrogenase
LKLAILDDLQNAVRSLTCFEKLSGHEVLVLTRSLAGEALVEAVGDREGLVLLRERTRFDDALLAQLPRLKLLSQTGRPGPHLDEAACTRRGIVITQGTGGPNAPAELAFALILAARRRVVEEASALRAGVWQPSPIGQSVRGQSLGILGYGAIGRLVGSFAKTFGMRVLAHGRAGSEARATADGVPLVSRAELFASSDVLSVHLKLNELTRHGVRLEELLTMKPGALLVNTARAELLAPGALLTALDAGRPGGAALDVFELEPAVDEPLVRHPRVLATPHLGYVEQDNYERYFGAAFDNVNAFARGEPCNVVNPRALDPHP